DGTEVPAYAGPVMQIVEEAIHLSLMSEPGVFAQLDEQREGFIAEVRRGLLRPIEQEILEKRGFARARIAENDKTWESRVADDLEDRAWRLIEVSAAMLCEQLFVEIAALHFPLLAKAPL